MQQKHSITAVKDYDFGTEANQEAVQAIRDYCNKGSLTEKQQDLIVHEHHTFICSNSPENSIFLLAVREVDFANDDYPYEQMVKIFRLAGHAGEHQGIDINDFVHAVVIYPDFFGEGFSDDLATLESEGETETYTKAINLLDDYIRMASTVDRKKLAYAAALDWINTKIDEGEFDIEAA